MTKKKKKQQLKSKVSFILLLLGCKIINNAGARNVFIPLCVLYSPIQKDEWLP